VSIKIELYCKSLSFLYKKYSNKTLLKNLIYALLNIFFKFKYIDIIFNTILIFNTKYCLISRKWTYLKKWINKFCVKEKTNKLARLPGLVKKKNL